MDTFKGDETLGGGLDFDLGLVRRDLGDDFDQVFQKAVCRLPRKRFIFWPDGKLANTFRGHPPRNAGPKAVRGPSHFRTDRCGLTVASGILSRSSCVSRATGNPVPLGAAITGF